MPRTTKPRTKPNTRANATAGPPAEAPPAGEVLTLAEAAAYLRIPEEEVLRLVQTDGLPGRRLGEEWRFLKSALQDWLRAPPAEAGKKGMLSQIGALKDDPYLDEMLR